MGKKNVFVFNKHMCLLYNGGEELCILDYLLYYLDFRLYITLILFWNRFSLITLAIMC